MSKSNFQTYVRLLNETLREIMMTPKTDKVAYERLKKKAKRYLLKVEVMKSKQPK